VDKDGMTLLHKATDDRWNDNVSKWGIAVAKYLVSQGADVNAKGRWDETPLHTTESVEIAKYLVSQGADVNAKSGSGSSGKTPLHKAASRWHGVEIVKILVSAGANVNAKNNDGVTPLHEAARLGKDGSAKYLISQGADVNVGAKDSRFGITILHWAATGDDVEFVKYLVSKGADVNAKTNNGKTPLHFADSDKSVEIVKYLVSQGVDVNAKEKDGWTPLHSLATRPIASLEVAKILVSAGANVNAKNDDGETPLDKVKVIHPDNRNRMNYTEKVKYLESIGAQ